MKSKLKNIQASPSNSLYLDMGKIKIIRKGIWETNSSSSHAVTVFSGDLIRRGDPEFNLDIRDNILYVPIRVEDFGWDFGKSNQPEIKLQYVCALILGDSYEGYSGKAQKREKILTSLLKDYLGVSGVVYQWNTEFLNDLEEMKKDGGNLYRAVPSVDHQSREDSYLSICTSKIDIINFIFSRRSWWYGGNDNSEAPADYYSEIYTYPEGSVNRIISVVLPGEIGRYDIEVQYDQSIHDAVWYGPKKVFEYTYYDLKTNTVKVKTSGSFNPSNPNTPTNLPYYRVIEEKGVFYVVYGEIDRNKGFLEKDVFVSPVIKIPMTIKFKDIDYDTEN